VPAKIPLFRTRNLCPQFEQCSTLALGALDVVLLCSRHGWMLLKSWPGGAWRRSSARSDIARFTNPYPCLNRGADFRRLTRAGASCVRDIPNGAGPAFGMQPEPAPIGTRNEHFLKHILDGARRNSELCKSRYIPRSDIIDLHQLDLVAGQGRVREHLRHLRQHMPSGKWHRISLASSPASRATTLSNSS